MEGYKEVTSAIEGRLFVSTRKHHEASKDNEVYFQSRPQALPSVDSWLSPFTSKITLPSNKTKSSGGEDGEKQQQQKRPSGQATHGHPSPPRSGATPKGLPNIKDHAADQTVAVADGFTLSLELAEPILYLEGFDFPHNSEHRSTVLRGVMNLTILKPTTLSALRLNFRGENETIWPEAWRVRKLHKVFREEVVQQTWNFLRTDKNSGVDDITATTTAAATSTTNRNAKQHTRRFEPGQYSFPFERPLESWLPESINLPLGKLSYTLTALAAAGAGEGGQYSSTATLTQPVTLVRIPCMCSLELSEPYEVHGLLHGLRYSFNLAAKSCRVGGQLPMTIKIASPPDRSWQSINVSLVEDMQYQTRNGLAYREQSRTKAVLYTNRAKRDPLHQRALRRISAAGEKMAPSYASGVVIEKKEGDDMWLHRSLSHHEYVTDGGGGGTGTDPDYQYLHEKALLNIPSCSKIDADTAYKCLYVRHYLSITIAAHVQVNENDRKQFQIRIRMPIQILTCKLCDGNATLPVYSENPPLVSSGLSGCEDESTAMPPLPPPSSPPPPADLCRCVSASRSYEGRGSFQSQDG